jgi:hypothetical protein
MQSGLCEPSPPRTPFVASSAFLPGGCDNPLTAAASGIALKAVVANRNSPQKHVWRVGGVAGHEARSRGRLGQRQMAINYRTRFAYRIDMWDAEGENIIEHLAGVEDLQFAKATYPAACKRWPGAPITLSEGMHVIEDNRRKRLV